MPPYYLVALPEISEHTYKWVSWEGCAKIRTHPHVPIRGTLGMSVEMDGSRIRVPAVLRVPQLCCMLREALPERARALGGRQGQKNSSKGKNKWDTYFWHLL